ncbi:TBC1 domain family member 30 [Dissostichus eleginoides]|uniref:TBC1 domain family member 30 n=1 Tax=Dissostichus eleginoides TaxID=100907 RepID=A0AAD9FHP1_DISEL|nr:TBC1 domain family member 30 [Dissostichus eleginoides]
MRQDRLPAAGRRPRAARRRQQQGSGGVGNIISNVLRKRNGISRSAPRLLCTLEPEWIPAVVRRTQICGQAPYRDTKGMEKEDWDKTLRFAFNERSNPDDDSLGIQIVKDLHRTGCSSYCGQEGEQDRVVLKRVLLAYARWNKSVGYCQGFNVLAALILEVTEGHESDALKVMIYLIDKVLPESYFANNLRALSVDMAVFRDLLRLKLPRLHSISTSFRKLPTKRPEAATSLR